MPLLTDVRKISSCVRMHAVDNTYLECRCKRWKRVRYEQKYYSLLRKSLNSQYYILQLIRTRSDTGLMSHVHTPHQHQPVQHFSARPRLPHVWLLPACPSSFHHHHHLPRTAGQLSQQKIFLVGKNILKINNIRTTGQTQTIVSVYNEKIARKIHQWTVDTIVNCRL